MPHDRTRRDLRADGQLGCFLDLAIKDNVLCPFNYYSACRATNAPACRRGNAAEMINGNTYKSLILIDIIEKRLLRISHEKVPDLSQSIPPDGLLTHEANSRGSARAGPWSKVRVWKRNRRAARSAITAARKMRRPETLKIAASRCLVALDQCVSCAPP